MQFLSLAPGGLWREASRKRECGGHPEKGKGRKMVTESHREGRRRKGLAGPSGALGWG